MCLAVPGKITTIDRAWAEVDIMGIQSSVNIQLIENPEVGDYILIHAGCAIQKIQPEYFSYLGTMLTELMDKDNEDGQ